MFPPNTYTTCAVTKLTGFTPRQLDTWASDLVPPSIQQSSGSGTRRLYSFRDLIQLQLIMRLKQAGISTQKIRKAVDTIKAVMQDENPLKHGLIVNSGGTLVALFKTKKEGQILLDALNAGGQQILPLVLETLEEETYQLVLCFADKLTADDEADKNAVTLGTDTNADAT